MWPSQSDGHDVDVLVVAYSPPQGAIAENVSTIARDLSSVARVAVLAPEGLTVDAGSLVDDIRFTYSTRRPDRAIWGSGWRAHRRAAALRPRVTLLFTQHPLNIVAALHLRRSRLAMWWHEPLGRGQVNRLKALVYRIHDFAIAPRCAAILVAAPSVLSNVPRRFQAKASVVPFATMSEFGADSYRFAADPSDVLFFGKLAPYKGLDVLASALGRLDEADCHPYVRLIGAGALEKSAPKMAAFKRRHPGQVDHVDEYAPPADIGSALAATRLVVFPYLSAAGSLTIPIAGMHSSAVVASQCGCFSDFLTNEESALLVTPGDDVALSDALLRLLSDDGLRRHLGAGLHALTQSTFEPGAVTQKMLAALGIETPSQ